MNDRKMANNHKITQGIFSKQDIFIAIFVFILFFTIYFAYSNQLIQKTPIEKFDDILFEIDTARAIVDMTIFSGYHYRTEVHPIYVLLINPIGEIMGRILPSNATTAIFINTFFGAIGTAMAYLVSKLIKFNTFSAIVTTFVFGFSTSQFFLSIIPDTASLAICTLIITYALFIYSTQYQNAPQWVWILAGILSLGVTTTNFAQTVICYAILQWHNTRGKNIPGLIWRVIRLILIVLAIVSGLAMLQKAIYPSSTLFFLPRIYFEELGYASISIFDTPLKIISTIFKSFFIDTIIAPRPSLLTFPEREIPAITFTGSAIYTVPGMIGLISWTCLFISNLYQRIKNKAFNLTDAGLGACLAFNLLLHSFYGIGEKNKIELFLYTGNLTFLVLMLITGWLRNNSKRILQYVVITPLMTALIINNLLVIQEITVILSAYK